MRSIRAATSRSVWDILRGNLFTFFNALVVSGFGVLLVLGRWQDALFGVTALANIVIGTAQEYRAKRVLDRLQILSAPRARVVRDGVEQVVEQHEVAVDDTLVLRSGDEVTADAVILEATRLEIDESLLTGESTAVSGRVGDRLLSGSTILAGSASAQVVAVGADSFAGRVLADARRFSLVRSELRAGIDRVLRWISWALIPLAAVMCNAQVQVQGGWRAIFSSAQWRQATVDTVAALIAMIPLGLVLITSIAFFLGARSLARQRVLVQELAAVEGLARIDVLCIDKTGTLTERELAGVDVEPFDVDIGTDAWSAALGWFASDPAAGPSLRALHEDFPERGVGATAHVEFAASRRWSAATLDGIADGTWVVGAADVLAKPCGVSSSSHEGARLLLLARTTSPLDESGDEPALPLGLRAIALIALREKIRADARRTLQFFEREGVEVRIISGDGADAVAFVARSVGLTDPVLDVREIADDPERFAAAVLRHRLLARVTPDQKRAAVHVLQRAGHTVAMTGDGVNDALAVKDADLGIAMGSAADATKAISRVVLLDDRFDHLPAVVAQGRKVIANVERVSVLFLTKTVAMMLLAVGLGALVLETPFLPRQLSASDGLTIGIPAFVLALLRAGDRYRPGLLRRVMRAAVPNGVILGAALITVAAYGRTLALPQAQVRTATTAVLVCIGLSVLAMQSRPIRGWRMMTLAAMVAVALGADALPFVRSFFVLQAPPEAFSWFCAGVAAAGCGAAVASQLILQRTDRPGHVTTRAAARPTRPDPSARPAPDDAAGARAARRSSH
ncbi:HAD-IC family P-type ATPase [Curtobacterium ammoniigenes]|uniref:HAD-IC family P-type ATPase n=1 Tax=Curtobacterium ammoniigenes TaxID=395387 RepID=UPI000833FB65|nr:HAD-IC family P-type ATPase [Curtobacterium ammoniigenes]